MAHQLTLPDIRTVAISKEDRAFFIALGTRIAELRKTQNITQVQLAETLGISQQTMNAYEMGHRRVPVSALTSLARSLGGVDLTEVSVHLGKHGDDSSRARLPPPRRSATLRR